MSVIIWIHIIGCHSIILHYKLYDKNNKRWARPTLSVCWFYRLISASKLEHQIHCDIKSRELHDATSITDMKPVGEVNAMSPRPVRILQHCSATLKVPGILTSITLQAGTFGGLKNFPGTKFRPQFLRWESVLWSVSPAVAKPLWAVEHVC